MTNPAFSLLREHKEVRAEVETMVMKMAANKIQLSDMLNAFEKGIAGHYGKFIVADVQTIMSWINRFLGERSSGNSDYLSTPLMSKGCDWDTYPNTIELWQKEINKAYAAWQSGVSSDNFNHELQYYLVCDGKIKVGDIDKYLKPDYLNRFDQMAGPNEEIKQAHKKSLDSFFKQIYASGWKFVYFIKEKSEQL